jgi:hypothetical protein
MSKVSASVGSRTSIFWKRRDSARSLSNDCFTSLNVVDPMQRSVPLASAGLSRLPAIHGAARRRAGADEGVDLVDEDDRVLFLREPVENLLHALLEVAAVARARHERTQIERVDVAVLSTSGTSPSWMRSASPSASAVLPTPGSPTSSGLFLRRRQSTCTIRSISAARPISGSMSPCAAF